MGTKQTVVNIPVSTRGHDTNFSEMQAQSNIGPTNVLPPNTSLENNALPNANVQTVAVWTVMDKFDENLKKAIVDFIDTTKEGVKAPHTKLSRTKTLTFDFFGTGTKAIRPGEIGEFYLTFSYPPGANTLSSSIVANTSTFNL